MGGAGKGGDVRDPALAGYVDCWEGLVGGYGSGGWIRTRCEDEEDEGEGVEKVAHDVGSEAG